MSKPIGAQQVRNISEYHASVRELTHVAVLRPHGVVKYFHHYLVLCVGNDNVEIVHYSPGKDALKDWSVAKITKQTLKFNDTDSNLLDFSTGLFFITRQNYPSNPDEKVMAYRRVDCRMGETEYSVASNNCESLVTWVLTGEASCEQFAQSKTGIRILIDLIDSGFDQVKKLRNGQSVLPSRLAATALSHTFTKSADKLVLAGATAASKVRPSAQTAGVTAGITGLLAVPIEATFCGLEIHELHKLRKGGCISKTDYKRQVTKKVSGSASSVTGATGAGFLGAFIGQIIVPIPVLGSAIGGAVGGIIGSIVGRTGGSAVSGKIFDAVTDE